MTKLLERRNSSRIDLKSINTFFRQCDISVSTSNYDLDITILNISSKGMKLKLNCDSDLKKINCDSQIFIRGCIFNDRIGFLSNQKAVVAWQADSLIGLCFTPELEFDDASIREMVQS